MNSETAVVVGGQSQRRGQKRGWGAGGTEDDPEIHLAVAGVSKASAEEMGDGTGRRAVKKAALAKEEARERLIEDYKQQLYGR